MATAWQWEWGWEWLLLLIKLYHLYHCFLFCSVPSPIIYLNWCLVILVPVIIVVGIVIVIIVIINVFLIVVLGGQAVQLSCACRQQTTMSAKFC
jgi:hypothetical protein